MDSSVQVQKETPQCRPIAHSGPLGLAFKPNAHYAPDNACHDMNADEDLKHGDRLADSGLYRQGGAPLRLQRHTPAPFDTGPFHEPMAKCGKAETRNEHGHQKSKLRKR